MKRAMFALFCAFVVCLLGGLTMRLPIAPPTPTASKLALAFVCPASVQLSQGVPFTPTKFASWGDLVHRGADRIYSGDERDAFTISFDTAAAHADKLDKFLQHFAEQYKLDIASSARDGTWHVEVGYAYDLRAGEVRGPYKREPGQTGNAWEVCGSSDFVFRRIDGKLVIRDWKPDDGKTARTSDPSTHHQLWFLALCASRVHGFGAGVVVELGFYSERGIWIEQTEITHDELVDFESNLLSLGPLLEAYPQPRPGWHCDGLYCPARESNCSAARALAERTVDVVQPLPAELLRRAATTPEEAAQQYHALHVLRKVEPLLEQHVRAYAHAKGPIPLGFGIEAVAKVSKGRDAVLDTPEAIRELSRALAEVGQGELSADDFTERTTSKPLLLNAWAKRSGKKKSGADAKKFMEGLRVKGLIVEGAPSIRIEERRAGQVEEPESEVL